MFSTFLCRLFAIALFGASVLRGAVLVQDSVDSARISRLQSIPSADLVLIDAGHEDMRTKQGKFFKGIKLADSMTMARGYQQEEIPGFE